MTGLAQLERQALAATFTRVGPDVPTLCGHWSARDLAAHLVIRERRPDAAAGVVVPVLAEHTARVQNGYAGQSWPTLVEMVRKGPPGWTPLRVPAVDEAVNLVEFFVHHEDVLRAEEGWTPRQARRLEDEVQAALWSRLRHGGQLMFRRSPVGVALIAPGHGRKQVHSPTRRGAVEVTGSPGELVLLGFGRGQVAQVEITGSPDAIDLFRDTSFGI